MGGFWWFRFIEHDTFQSQQVQIEPYVASEVEMCSYIVMQMQL